MRLTLQPNGRSSPGLEPTSYRVELPHREIAILDRVENVGWHLSVRERGQVIDRGMFATTHDVLALLEAEYLPQAVTRNRQI